MQHDGLDDRAEIYHFARGGELTIKKLSPVFWSLTITMYCAVILLYVFDATLYALRSACVFGPSRSWRHTVLQRLPPRMQSEDTSFSKAGNPVEETLLIVDAAIFICSSLGSPSTIASLSIFVLVLTLPNASFS
jgi:hypothetical protein